MNRLWKAALDCAGKIGLIACFVFATSSAYAANPPNFTTAAAGYSSTDLQTAEAATTGSISAHQMLHDIFGPIADNPLNVINGNSGNNTLGTVFMFLNMGLLTLGGLYLSYKGVSAVSHTAQHGEFMGKEFNSVWVPIRLTTGIFSLIPFAGGWSLLQIAMLWFGIMGAGLGNMTWQAAVGDSFLPFPTVTLSPPTGGSFDKQFIPALFKIHACVAAHNKQLGMLTKYGHQLIATSGASGGVVLTGSNVMGFIQYGSNMGANHECGQVAMADVTRGTGGSNSLLASSTYSGAGSSLWGSTSSKALGIQTQNQRIKIQQAALIQFKKVDRLVKAMADKYVASIALYVNNPTAAAALVPFDPLQLRNMNLAYQGNLTVSIAGAMNASSAMSKQALAMKKHAKDEGFVTAGAWYMTMAQSSYAMNSIVHNVSPSIRMTPQAPNYNETIWLRASQGIDAANKNSGINLSTGSAPSGNQDAAWKLIVAQMSGSSAWFSPGQSVIAKMISESSGQPFMIRIKNLADDMVTLSVSVITASGFVKGALLSTKDAAGAASSVPVIGGLIGAVGRGAIDLASGPLKPFLDMTLFAGKLAMGFFLMCSLYLPIVPFVIFMGQVLNWLISVVEGVAAAPFLAFAHLDTDGEGLGHKTQYGYIFMLQNFMRPTMLVLGFMFACLLLEVIGGYVMQIFPLVVANVQMDSMTGLFSIMGFVAIFMVMMVGLVNSCMTVMYLLPDAIFQFIGARDSATAQVGRDQTRTIENSSLGGAAILGRAEAGVVTPTHNGRQGGEGGGVKKAGVGGW